MNSRKDIPVAVMQEAKGLIELYGDRIAFIGKHNGLDVYEYMFPENTETGYPFLYLYDRQSDKATEVTEFEALEILYSEC